jgi:GNAT superfamily N-acetyltransferase
VIAYDGEAPVGWAAVEPRPAYRRIVDGDDAGTWAVTCFVVRVGHRRRGVARALLEGAVDQARAAGALVVEAFPTVASGETSSADLYHGPLSVFEAAGFEVVERPSDRRAVVRLALR